MLGMTTDKRADLERAFDTFNKVSGELTGAYTQLEQKVMTLQAALARAEGERQAELLKTERLANRLSHLLDALPGGVVVIDGEGRISQANPAAQALLGAPLEGEPWLAVIQRTFDPRPTDGHEISLRDGRLVSVATRSLEPEPGQIVMLTDLTETRSLQERVSRQERLTAMGEMVAGLAHQLRTPLAAALLYGSHLTRDDLAADRARQTAGKLIDRLRHLDGLVNDMLLFARGGASVVAPVDVAGLIESVRHTVEPVIQAANGKLTIEMSAADASLIGNREALTGALVNLVNNAVQATGNAVQVALGVALENSQIVIQVRDNGPGIAPALQARIFEPFYTTRSDGTGLGLAVVAAVAQAHGGSISVESKVGEGTVFSLRLPAIKKENP
jgi:two-component system sensor histidine kinase FlrB